MEITGRVYHINPINEKVIQVVLKKKVYGKDTPIAFAVVGFWKDVVVDKLKLKPKDKIKGTVILKSNLYKGKYYTDVNLKDIEIVPDKPKETNEGSPTLDMDIDDMGGHIIDEETGEILL
jgi:hypothetical protein